jgi:type VI secretion system secreted protein VgrG
MLNELHTFFDYSRHTLRVRGVDARLDVLAFHGEERLSQPFTYGVEFTCTQGEIVAEDVLGLGNPEYPIKTPLQLPEPQ